MRGIVTFYRRALGADRRPPRLRVPSVLWVKPALRRTITDLEGGGDTGGFTNSSTWMVEEWTFMEGRDTHPAWLLADLARPLAAGLGALRLAALI